MPKKLTEKEVRKQSETAFAQSGEKWKRHAKINGELYRRNKNFHRDLALVGMNKVLVVAGMGASLEDHIETLKKYQVKQGVDIACCDKGFKILFRHGIKPRYVFLADANIKYDQWVQDVIDQTGDTILISSICANPLWAQNWRGKVYFYVNKDNIGTEKIYSSISGCSEMIPAASNVGNAMLVFATQTMGYKEYLLIGYDFSWAPGRNYYAYNDNNKRHWMRVYHLNDINGEYCYTSENLLFSCRWLQDYYNGPISASKIKMFNCSGRGILNIPQHDLEKRLEKYAFRYPDRNMLMTRKMAKAQTVTIDKNNGAAEELMKILKNNDIVSAQITYCEKDKSEVIFV